MAIDKEHLYGNYLRSKERREKLKDEVFRHARDMNAAEDDMENIGNRTTTTTTNNAGLGRWGTMAVILGSMLGGASLMGIGSMLTNRPATPAAAPEAPKPQKFRVKFSTEEGKPIEVQKP